MPSDSNNWVNLSVFSQSAGFIARYGLNKGVIDTSLLDNYAGSLFASNSLQSEISNGDPVLISSYELANSKRLVVRSDVLEELTSGELVNIGSFDRLFGAVQVQGKNLTENEVMFYQEMARLLVNETALRLITGELKIGPGSKSVTQISILKDALEKFNLQLKDKQLISKNTLLADKILDLALDKVFSDNKKVLEKYLSKVPLIDAESSRDSFNQEDYVQMISECKSFVEKEISFFEEVIDDIDYFNQKLFSGEKSLQQLIEDYEALNLIRKEIRSKKENLLNLIRDVIPMFEEQGFYSFKEIFPKEDSLDDLLKKVRSELLSTTKQGVYLIEGGESKTLNKLKERVNSITLTKKEDLEAYRLKNLLNKAVLLMDNVARYDNEASLQIIRASLYDILEEGLPKERSEDETFFKEMDKEVANHDEGFNSLFKKVPNKKRSGAKILVDKLDSKKKSKNIADYSDFRDGYWARISSLESVRSDSCNLEHIIVAEVYEHVFEDFRNFQYVLSYAGDFKDLVYSKVKSRMLKFVDEIQNYSFPSVLNRLLDKIKTEDFVKKVSINLLKNYLGNFLYSNFKKDPLIKLEDNAGKELNPTIAFDSYSLDFCSEIIRRVGLDDDVGDVINEITITDSYQKQFIQLMGDAGLTKQGVAIRLKNSGELFDSWIKTINDKINELGLPEVKKSSKKKSYVFTAEDVIEKAKSLYNYELDYKKKGRTKQSEEDKRLQRREFVEKKIFFGKKEEELKEIIESYSDRSDIVGTINKLEEAISGFEKTKKSNERIIELNKTLSDEDKKELELIYFDNGELADIIIDFKRVLEEGYLDDLKLIKKISEDISNLMTPEEFDEINKLTAELNSVLNGVESVVEKKEQLSQIRNSFEEIVEYEKLKKTLNDLKRLDNGFLKLQNYDNILGGLNTVVNPGTLVKPSKIEDKNRSEDLLMQSLVNIYAQLHEDYYGGFKTPVISRTNSLISNLKLKKNNVVEVMPGKYFKELYSAAAEVLKVKNGINFLGELFQETTNYKSKILNPVFLLNYLVDYAEFKELSGINLIKSFSDSLFFKEFAEDQLINKFKQLKPVLKDQLTNYWHDINEFLKGSLKKKPVKPFELGLIKSGFIDTLDSIIENVDISDSLIQKHFYLDGVVEEEGHPALKHNLGKVPFKKVQSIINSIDKLDSKYDQLVKKLVNQMLKFKPRTVSYDDIVSEINEQMQGIVNDELKECDLYEFELPNINKIRIRSSLDPLRYVIPDDVEKRLPVEKRQRDYYMKLIKASINISHGLKHSMLDVFYKNKVFNELLNTNVLTQLQEESTEESVQYLVTNVEIPVSKLKSLFGNSLLMNGDKVEGLKLPFYSAFNQGEKELFGNALRNNVAEKIYSELKPVKVFLDDYSSKIHTGFQKVADELKLTELT